MFLLFPKTGTWSHPATRHTNLHIASPSTSASLNKEESNFSASWIIKSRSSNSAFWNLLMLYCNCLDCLDDSLSIFSSCPSSKAWDPGTHPTSLPSCLPGSCLPLNNDLSEFGKSIVWGDDLTSFSLWEMWELSLLGVRRSDPNDSKMLPLEGGWILLGPFFKICFRLKLPWELVDTESEETWRSTASSLPACWFNEKKTAWPIRKYGAFTNGTCNQSPDTLW